MATTSNGKSRTLYEEDSACILANALALRFLARLFPSIPRQAENRAIEAVITVASFLPPLPLPTRKVVPPLQCYHLN